MKSANQTNLLRKHHNIINQKKKIQQFLNITDLDGACDDDDGGWPCTTAAVIVQAPQLLQHRLRPRIQSPYRLPLNGAALLQQQLHLPSPLLAPTSSVVTSLPTPIMPLSARHPALATGITHQLQPLQLSCLLRPRRTSPCSVHHCLLEPRSSPTASSHRRYLASSGCRCSPALASCKRR